MNWLCIFFGPDQTEGIKFGLDQTKMCMSWQPVSERFNT